MLCKPVGAYGNNLAIFYLTFWKLKNLALFWGKKKIPFADVVEWAPFYVKNLQKFVTKTKHSFEVVEKCVENITFIFKEVWMNFGTIFLATCYNKCKTLPALDI
jgi:hypothetical protein